MASKRDPDTWQCIEMEGLVEARHHHKHPVFSTQHSFATDFYLKMWYDSIKNAFWGIFYGKYYH